jgi:hypothetical protein
MTTPAAREKQLNNFISKFDRNNQALIRATRRALRGDCPPPTNSFTTTTIFSSLATVPRRARLISIAAGANRVSLSFYHGATLADPQKVLLGNAWAKLLYPSVVDVRRGRCFPEIERMISVPLPVAGRGVEEGTSLAASPAKAAGFTTHLRQ